MLPSDLMQFQWHNLPIERISISEAHIEIVVTPYSEELRDYERFSLQISDSDSVTLDLQGTLSPADLEGLEVTSVNSTVDDARRLSGKLSCFPGTAGLWRIQFSNAKWILEKLGI